MRLTFMGSYYFHTWPPVGGTVREGFGGVIFREEESRREVFEVPKASCQMFFLLSSCDFTYEHLLFLSPYLCFTMIDFIRSCKPFYK